jgi:choline-sulfatase
MYEESAGIPMIASGPDIMRGVRVRTPVSHLDAYPSVMQSVGGPQPLAALSGKSMFDIARQPYDEKRTVFSEYHAAGSVSAAYMLRQGKYKYIYYTGFEPELFDLEADPEELFDLAGRAESGAVLDDFHGQMLAYCNPIEVDRQAKAAQDALIITHGGVEQILNRGGSSYTPIPGEEVKLIGNG